jgi:dTDP-4-amino-4,6-dideoxygalactose transaminase
MKPPPPVTSIWRPSQVPTGRRYAIARGRRPDFAYLADVPDWLVPLADVRFTEEEVQAVADVYRAGWLSQGPRVAAFEAAFAGYVGSREAVAVSSGTAALELAFAAARLQPGDEVVVPSLTFAATAAAVVRAGGTPVFADVRGVERPCLSAAATEDALSERTRAIVNVAYAGHLGETAALRALADARGVRLIEDAAHAVGAWSGERHAGTVGHAGTFSFFANKNMPLGEGGMLVTDDGELATRARLLRSHGLSSGTWARHRGEQFGYDVLEPGFNYRLDEPRAALGTLLLGRLTDDNRRRAALAVAYADGLHGLSGVRRAIAPEAGVRCAWHIFPLLLDPAVDRDRFRARLHDAGVQTSVHYPPLHLTTAFSGLPRGRLEVTEEYARRTVTVPLFAHMTESQLQLVLDTIAGAVRQ